MLPLDKSQTAELFRRARDLERVGKLEQARRTYETILTLDPKSAPARFQIAQVHFKLGRFEDTIASIEKALELAPREKALWGLYGRALQRIDDPKRNANFLKTAKKARLDRAFLLSMQSALGPQVKVSNTQIGTADPQAIRAAIALLESGDKEAARARAQALHKAHPDVPIIADLLASALDACEQPEEAERYYRLAGQLGPNYAETRVNYGRFLLRAGRNDEAAAELRRAVAIVPGSVTGQAHLGLALSRTGRPREAEAAFRRALREEPDNVFATMELGRHLLVERSLQEALELFEKALKLGADERDVRLCLSGVYWFLGREPEALEEADKVLAMDPELGPAYRAKASVYQALGDFDAAREAFRKAIEYDPLNGENYRVYLIAEKLKPGDPLIAKMEEVFAHPDITDVSKANVGFALAKALEDTKEYGRVFTYLRPANEILKTLFPFDLELHRRKMEVVKRQFGDTDLQALDVPGRTDFAPIFVTGLPRSGTTLVEQIIASHSTVTGGGELGYTRSEIARAMMTETRQVRNWGDMTDDEIIAIGDSVERQMRAQVPGADKITDKGIEGYTLIGGLRAVLPRARIVVVRRDPRDNLLSNYKNMFVGGKHSYSYDLTVLGQFYRVFEDIVGFWREKVPGWFYEIQYEDLVANPEAEARKLISACDLEWEDQCLAFYENKRRVDTLSVHQVRQPIYASSTKAWQRYEDELGELFDALGGEYARPAAG